MPVDDPFDSATPMLTYAEVRELVTQLPIKAQEELSLGPIEERRRCRVCAALEPLLPVHPTEPVETYTDLEQVATALKTWHDDLGRSSWFADVVEPKLFPGEAARVVEEEKHIFGCIQYARCCLIYAFADLEISLKGNG